MQLKPLFPDQFLKITRVVCFYVAGASSIPSVLSQNNVSSVLYHHIVTDTLIVLTVHDVNITLVYCIDNTMIGSDEQEVLNTSIF